MLYGRTQRNEPSRFLREIEPGIWKRPAARCWNSAAVWAAGAATTATRCPAVSPGYLNREYNAGESRGFGSGYAGRGVLQAAAAAVMAPIAAAWAVRAALAAATAARQHPKRLQSKSTLQARLLQKNKRKHDKTLRARRCGGAQSLRARHGGGGQACCRGPDRGDSF